VAGPFLPPVDPAGITRRKILHAARQRGIARLKSQMNMVGHETECVNSIAETAGAFLKQEIKPVAVIVGKEYRLAAVASENDVVESAGEMDAWFACHLFWILQSL